ncbi:hypothetical protein NW768_002506 [Fusarium equiseti]|uniref:Myb-like domain-containing protein n=1 Tax=Fusarium equiseti TaxID=61235 RepID=A0ABQ8RNL9_FUSEQ|nr:hypothetical protein NW768_002506 [Fusarium equiseti]
MKPWHEKALRKGRTPLPDAPGVRPWIHESGETSAPGPAPTSTPAHASAGAAVPASTESPAADAASTPAVDTAPAETADGATAPESSSATPGTTGASSQSYVFWRGDDLRRLVQMRNGGAKWSAIAEAFPDRTLEALKQTFHKRRHATERLMAEESAAAEAEAEVEAEGRNNGQ